MPNIQHSALDDSPNAHEPKGADTASSNTVYVADGSGSGEWKEYRQYVLVGVIDDISTASVLYLPTTFQGEVFRVTSVIHGAIATADATLTIKDDTGATMGTITVAESGSAAGDVDDVTPLLNRTANSNSFITVETDGASTNSVKATVAIHINRI